MLGKKLFFEKRSQKKFSLKNNFVGKENCHIKNKKSKTNTRQSPRSKTTFKNQTPKTNPRQSPKINNPSQI